MVTMHRVAQQEKNIYRGTVNKLRIWGGRAVGGRGSEGRVGCLLLFGDRKSLPTAKADAWGARRASVLFSNMETVPEEKLRPGDITVV